MGYKWNEAAIADHHAVRNALEPLVCREAAQYRRDNDIRVLEHMLETMENDAQDALTVLWVVAVSALAVGALAVVTGGRLFGEAAVPVRVLLVPAALCLLYLEPVPIAVGAGCGVAALVTHAVLRRRTA